MSELFDIKLNEKGKTHLLKLIKVINWVFILGLLLAALQFAIIVYLNKNFFVKKAYVGHFERMQHVALAWYIVSTILFVIQIVFYSKFSKILKQSINAKNEDQFNDSFLLLLKYAIVGLIVVLSALVYYVYFFVETFLVKV